MFVRSFGNDVHVANDATVFKKPLYLYIPFMTNFDYDDGSKQIAHFNEIINVPHRLVCTLHYTEQSWTVNSGVTI